MIKVILLLPLIILAACSTGYHSQNMFGNGFSEMRVNADAFIVNFKGNAYSKHDKVIQFAILRASQLTLENGFKYFRIVSSNDHSKYISMDSLFSKEPAVSLHIKCSHQKTNDPGEIDAQYFLTHNQE